MKSANALLAIKCLVLLLPGLSWASDEGSAELTAPSNLNAIVMGAERVSLSWYDNARNEQGYAIQRSEDGLYWHTIAELDRNAGEFQDAAVRPFTRYQYRVVAFDMGGEASVSNVDSVMTLPAASVSDAEAAEASYEPVASRS